MRASLRSALVSSALAIAGCGSGTAAEPPAAVPCGATAITAAGLVVTTVAGNGKPGFADGTGGLAGTAQFSNPNGIAVDAAGMLYVADYGNNRIRKVDLQGNVTTLAGNGTGGDLDGAGGPTGPAQFYQPFGVAVDHSGNVLVADSGSNRIRKIDPQGNVTTVAGNGAVGSADGAGGRAGVASFAHPFGVAVDPADNIYVADRFNNRIRRIDRAGTVTTYAGTGTLGFRDGYAGTAFFAQPTGVATDSAGNVYVADYLNNRIRRIDNFANVTTLAGTGTGGYYDGSGGPDGCAQFSSPATLAVSAQGLVYVTDGTNRLRTIDAAGDVRSVAGTGSLGFLDGPGASAEFLGIAGVAIDAQGAIFTCDNGNARIRAIKPAQQ